MLKRLKGGGALPAMIQHFEYGDPAARLAAVAQQQQHQAGLMPGLYHAHLVSQLEQGPTHYACPLSHNAAAGRRWAARCRARGREHMPTTQAVPEPGGGVALNPLRSTNNAYLEAFESRVPKSTQN